MKKALIMLLMAASTAAWAQEPQIDLHKKWNLVIEAIATVESNRIPSKVSPSGKYVGYLQISEILVRECNRIAGYQKYTYKDRLSRDKSIDMFIDFQEFYNPDGNMERAIRLWNSGDLKCMSRKARTEGYYRRVMSHYTQMAANR